jgi:hypothetical protein
MFFYDKNTELIYGHSYYVHKERTKKIQIKRCTTIEWVYSFNQGVLLRRYFSSFVYICIKKEHVFFPGILCLFFLCSILFIVIHFFLKWVILQYFSVGSETTVAPQYLGIDYTTTSVNREFFTDLFFYFSLSILQNNRK